MPEPERDEGCPVVIREEFYRPPPCPLCGGLFAPVAGRLRCERCGMTMCEGCG